MIQSLQQDLISAMKAKDDVRVGTLRLLLSSAKNKQIDLGHELSEDDFKAVVQREVKQRKDSISQFEAAGRADLAEEEKAELAVMQEYMPAQMSEEAIAVEVDKAVAESGAASASDIGKVMPLLGHLKGQADMGIVSRLVKKSLAN